MRDARCLERCREHPANLADAALSPQVADHIHTGLAFLAVDSKKCGCFRVCDGASQAASETRVRKQQLRDRRFDARIEPHPVEKTAAIRSVEIRERVPQIAALIVDSTEVPRDVRARDVRCTQPGEKLVGLGGIDRTGYGGFVTVGLKEPRR